MSARKPPPRILILGPRKEFASLVEPLNQKGCQVAFCPDGGKAVELAVSEGVDVMVVDTEMPQLSAPELFHLLRANPRCEGMAFFFVGAAGSEMEGVRRHRDFFLPRPLQADQLLGGIWAYLTRKSRTEQVGRQVQRVEGNLDQISLVDLLQIFNLNRKTGELTLSHDERKGVILLDDGAVVNATSGNVEGEKAFFRLIGWERGKFWFVPGKPQTEVRIRRPTEHLIMEGLRQADEYAALADQLPQREASLQLLVPVERLPRGLRPATQEILLLLQRHETVAEILDRSPQSDLDILQILKVLIDKGIVEVRKDRLLSSEGLAPLLSAEEILAIKERLGDRDILLEEASAKLLVLADTGSQLGELFDTLRGFADFRPDRQFQAGQALPGLGEMGRLAVGESFTLRIFSLPVNEQLTPLWRPFCRRLFGVIALADSADVRRAESYFREKVRVPVVACHSRAPGEVAFPLQRGNRDSLQLLLTHFANHYTGKSPVGRQP